MTSLAVRQAAYVVPAGDLWSRWLDNYRSAKTQGAYRRDVTQWATWCASRGVDVVRPTPGDVTAWVGAMRAAGKAESTLAGKVSAVLSFYVWARHDGVTDADPASFRRPKPDRDAVITLGLDVDQVHTVLDAAQSRGDAMRNFAFVALLVFCGLRVSEALGADVGDLAEQRGHHVVRVMGKGGRPRTVPMPAQVVRAIEAYLNGRTSGPMFVTRSGRRWSCRDAWETVAAIGRRAGVAPLHPHTFWYTQRSCSTPALRSTACKPSSATPARQPRCGTPVRVTGWTTRPCTTSRGTSRTPPGTDLRSASVMRVMSNGTLGL